LGELLPKDRDSSEVIRFDVFELDVRNAELRKRGRPIHLQPQPFKVLARLASEPGTLVSRDELQRLVWDGSAYVDFEQGLNFCIRQIRLALDDNTESPRFVETAPKRGYRFIAKLETTKRVAIPQTAGQAAPPEPARHEQPDEVFLVTEAVAPVSTKPSRRTWTWLVAVVLVASCAAIVGGWLVPRRESAPSVQNYTQITRDGSVKVPAYCCAVLATDRSRIFFSEVRNGRWQLVDVPISGGEVQSLSLSLQNVEVEDLAPSGSDLMVSGWETTSPAAPLDSLVWLVPLNGGSAHHLGGVLAHDGSHSPDGRTILYAAEHALYLCNADGGGSHRLVEVPGIPYRPRWSVDQKRVRFTLYDPRTGLDALWEVASDGAGLHALFPGHKTGTDECCGVWTADGKYFVYQSTTDRQTHIWVIPEQGGLLNSGAPKPVQLTSGPISFLAPAVYDRQHLLVLANKTRGELMRYDAARGQFATYLGGLSAEGLDFSQDGQFMAYISYPDGVLFRSRIDGSESRQITPADMVASLPRWSPDGRSIVFTGSRSGGPWKGYLISAEGGTPEQLVAGDGPEFDTVWSSDGTSLAFAESMSSSTSGIHLVDFESRQVSRLAGSDHLFSPRWSPDGRYLAALTTDSLNLLVFDFRSHRWRTLVRGKHVSYPTWLRDSASLAFRAIYDDGTPFYRVRVSDGVIKRIAKVAVPGSLAFSVSGAWSGLAPDGQPLLLRDTSLQEIYSVEVRWP
jgi:Tol biopolymer transport system component/DNA-binding winged helix-turn-helix (wHTH) protein